MKKFFTLAAAVAAVLSLNATNLWNETKHVNWENTLMIDASAFADAQEGNKLVITFAEDGANDVVEFKSNGQKLPGSRFTPLYDWMETHEYFLTQDAVDMLKQYGLELCGGGFDMTSLDLEDGKAGNLKEGKTIWTGYFWVDSWSTLEVFKEAFEGIDLTEYNAMRFYSECPNTDNLIFLLANWDPAGVVAKSEPATDDSAATNPLKRYEGYAELDLTQVNPIDVINAATSDRLMIQMDKQDNNPFNFTDIVLVSTTPTGVQNVENVQVHKTIENGQLVIINNGVKYNAQGAQL